MRSIPSLLRACSDAGLDPLREMVGVGAGVVAIFIVLMANAAFGVTGLSPFGPSPQAVSSASPLPSHFAGDDR